MAGVEELFEWFGEFHEEETGGFVDGLAGVRPAGLFDGEGVGVTKDDEDFLRRHFGGVLCILIMDCLYVSREGGGKDMSGRWILLYIRGGKGPWDMTP